MNKMVELLKGITEMKPTALKGRRMGLCPFHKGEVPCFVINEKGTKWFCLVCDEDGDYESLKYKLERRADALATSDGK